MVMARGSVFECVGIMDHLVDIEKISQEGYDYFYNTLEEISKMLYAIIKKLGED
jgi:four helix bundle protein